MTRLSSRTRKAASLSLALLRRPQDGPGYLRWGLRRRSPLDLGLPWTSFAAIEYLATRLHAESRVLELGGGGSTLFVGPRVRSVTTLESDPNWASALRNAASRASATNVTVLQLEAAFDSVPSFFASPYGSWLPETQYDVIIIDFPDYTPPHHLRPAAFTRLERFAAPGGTIVVDDSRRYQRLREHARAKAVVTRTGTGPGRRTTTTTDFYLY